MNDTSYGLVLCDDLVFTSRVIGTATALGLSMHAVKTVSELLDFARQTPPRCVILDLQTQGLVIETLVGELRALSQALTLVGYGSHVDAAALKRARDAGCDVVWPRSKFVEELSASLPVWFGSPEAA
jgi:ActR/RegA family two-component response regulator